MQQNVLFAEELRQRQPTNSLHSVKNNGKLATVAERNVTDTVVVKNGTYESNIKIVESKEENAKVVRFSLYSTAKGDHENAEPGEERSKHRSKYGCVRMLASDWIFLAVLGVLVAFLSISVDMMIYYFQEVQSMTFPSTGRSKGLPILTWILSLASWCTYTIAMVAASATFVHYVSPQAIGSGIPEMKTIIRGVVLKDYLTFKTLVSKIFGVAMSLGSGVPIGKMGPFVHIASTTANQLARIASHFDPAFKNEARIAECLAAACAVGVACTFSAPVGGVLFSIEVTTMYFSVRSYWRGFFAACCGAVTIRLARGFVAQTEVTVNAFFQTSFAPDAFVVNEIPLFVVLGIVCGLAGAMYISLYRTVVLFMRNNTCAKKLFQRHWIVYPLFVSLVWSIISFPHGLGRFTAGRLRFGTNLKDFFSNCTFTEVPPSFLACKSEILDHWLDNRENIIVFLFVFIVVHIVALALPYGLIEGVNIYPGVYAVVGAASFSASVTHTVSVSVMIFEITGQLHYILPVMISVLVSNAVCAYIQPSFFDTIIKIKHLPFLPDIPPSNHVVHTLCAEDIMISPVLFITRITSYADIQQILTNDHKLRILPVVDTAECVTTLLYFQIGDEARREEATRRVGEAIETIDMHFKTSMKEVSMNQRTKSESSIPQALIANAHLSLAPLSPVRRKNRFVISSGEIIEPTTSRRNSLTRRNAFCSLQPSSSDIL
ncbi:Chloride channel protein, partial [Trichostrongylus colubriformis]